MLKIGQKVRFEPLKNVKLLRLPGEVRRVVTGTVVYINHQNKWFSAEYICGHSGLKQRESFKFSQIGQDVMLCGK